MEKVNGEKTFSLLYPTDCPRTSGRQWDEKTVTDLCLDDVVMAISISSNYVAPTRSILLEFTDDIRIINYRQQILEDFMNCPEVSSGFEELLPSLGKLRDYSLTQSEGTPLQQTLGRLTELNTYVNCVKKLQSILSAAGTTLHSQGLRELEKFLEAHEEDETFQSLVRDLPELLARLNSVPSITIGINLDNELLPVEATLLSINDKPFKGGSLLDRLMGRKKGRKEDQGIGVLHELPYKTLGVQDRVVNLPTRVDPLLVPLFRDLHEVLRSVILPINDALKKYTQVNARMLISLQNEGAFFVGAAALIRRMRLYGLPMCAPDTLPAGERTCQVHELYNLLLAMRLADKEPETDLGKLIVANNADFGPDGRIFILTGPNQGGKTIYTQAVGLAHVLFQAGLHIPAEKARMSPVDGIYTHFASMESMEPGMGRLGEDAERLNYIFQNVTDQGLVLLNESLSSTSPVESLFLARDIVRALRLFGVRAIYATHLHELAEGLEKINAEVPGDSKVISLVAGVILQGESTGSEPEVVTRTFKIKPSPPRGLSFAREIAARHGISYQQLEDSWASRSRKQLVE